MPKESGSIVGDLLSAMALIALSLGVLLWLSQKPQAEVKAMLDHGTSIIALLIVQPGIFISALLAKPYFLREKKLSWRVGAGIVAFMILTVFILPRLVIGWMTDKTEGVASTLTQSKKQD